MKAARKVGEAKKHESKRFFDRFHFLRSDLFFAAKIEYS